MNQTSRIKVAKHLGGEHVEGDEGVVGTFWRDTFLGWRVCVHEHYANGKNPVLGAASRQDAIEILTGIWSKTHFGGGGF